MAKSRTKPTVDIDELERNAEFASKVAMLKEKMQGLDQEAIKNLRIEAGLWRVLEISNRKSSESAKQQAESLLSTVSSATDLLSKSQEEQPYQEELSRLAERRLTLTKMLGADLTGINNNLIAQWRGELRSLEINENIYKQMQAQSILDNQKKADLERQNQLLMEREDLQDRALQQFGLQLDQVKRIGAAIDRGLKSPWLPILGMTALALKMWSELEDVSDDFRKNTGLTTAQTGKFIDYTKEIQNNLMIQGVQYEDVLSAAESLFKVTGNIALLSKENMQYVAGLERNLAVAADDAAKFALQMTIAGKENQLKEMTEELRKMSVVAGVSVKEIMSDIADASAETYSYMSRSPREFMRTAVEARRIGMSMKQIADITEGLLDIENSLNAEMEAQILTGKTLNLDAARYYALIGDQGRAFESILGQITSLEEFHKMGPLAQQAYAKAVGTTVEELGKAIMLREKEMKMSPKERAERERLSKIDANIQSISEKLKNAWKTIVVMVSEIMLPVIEAMEPIFQVMVDAVGEVARFFKNHSDIVKWVTWLGLGGVALWKMVSASFALQRNWGSITKAVSSPGKWILDKLRGGAGGPLGKTTVATPDVAGGTGGGQALGKFGTFLKEVKPANMMAAGAAMIMVAGAVWILSKAMENFAQPEMWKGVLLGIAGMAALLGAVTLLGTFMMSGIGTVAILAGAAAMLVIAGAMWVLGEAMQSMASSSDGLVRLLSALSAIDPSQLMRVGSALGAVGVGFGALAVGGAAAGVVNTIFGGLLEGKGSTSTKAPDASQMIIEKLDKLIEVFEKKSFDVYLNGKKVTEELYRFNQYGGTR